MIAPRKAPPTEVLVVLPTYNERQNLEEVVAGVRRLGHDVMVVDDASPDGTGELADQLADRDSGVRVLHRPSKLGLGSAYEDAFQLGLQDGAQLFVGERQVHARDPTQPGRDAVRGRTGT